MYNYTELPESLLLELGQNKELTRAAAYAHGCCSAQGHHLHYCVMYAGKRYKIDAQIKETAKELNLKNVAEAVQNVGNKLVFVGMGCDYEPRYEGDPANHRIRTFITNPKGRKFFIEVGRSPRCEKMHIDFVIDIDQQNEFEALREQNYEKIQNAGGWNKLGYEHPLTLENKRLQSQPYYWFKKDVYFGREYRYDKETILNLVNTLFDCKFTEMEVDSVLLTQDNYTSVSPN